MSVSTVPGRLQEVLSSNVLQVTRPREKPKGLPLSMWPPRASYLLPLGLSFFICKMMVVITTVIVTTTCLVSGRKDHRYIYASSITKYQDKYRVVLLLFQRRMIKF